MGLGPETLKALAEVGYTVPTPIQAQAIPVVFMGKDVLGIAQTGTGKTASFTLPMIEILAHGRARARMPRSLVLTPTRELAAQVAASFARHGCYHKLNMALLVGGGPCADQIKLLDRGVDVLIATPGRLLDLFQRGRVLLSDVRILVIDEADRMLDMGFIPDVERIVTLLPRQRQTLFFSATMPSEVKRLAAVFLHEPREIRVAPPAKPADCVVQRVVMVESHDKYEVLHYLLRKEEVRSAFIFCNRKRDISILHRSLIQQGFPAGMLHGDMLQSMRTETLEQFKAGEISLLVCSDVAARGIDISAMSHVFNFDVPAHAGDYIHRIGRTGRAGMSGHALTIAVPEDSNCVAAIEQLIGHQIPRVMIDDRSEGARIVGYYQKWCNVDEESGNAQEQTERRMGYWEGEYSLYLLNKEEFRKTTYSMQGFGEHIPDFFSY
ncbi:ATP-dependent RNA helicase Atu1833 [invertebrate metagenome]|uniref:ATP-dependent RNA helicase Atu1833 n=1 Tax=invertebrate metagenome TaxID=1711999 RepID=A0A484H599_9ZZZZ